jgi:fibronectin type 3 domain-containing protein
LPTDLLQQHPTAVANYAVETLNDRDRSAGLSNQIAVPLAPTLPAPTALEARATAEGIVLTWSGPPATREFEEINYVYRVYRRVKGEKTDLIAGEVPVGNSSQATFVDHGFEWQKTYEYRVAPVTVISIPHEIPVQVEGDDSAPAEVFANDVFPPSIPAGLQAVASGVGQQPFVDLTWAPNTESDLAGYNVYRHEEGEPAAKINTELVKTPAYRDNSVHSGKKYFYSVSAVDLRGNESDRSEEASETLP